MSNSTKQLKVDDEIRPTVEALGEATDKLLGIARRVYVPSNVADTVIGEVLPVPQQLQLYVASAHLVLASTYCQKRLANEPIPEKLKEQIQRVQGYLKKLKDHGIDIGSIQAGASGSAAAVGSPDGAPVRRQRGGGATAASEQTAPSNNAADKKRRQVDPRAVKNVGKMLENKGKKDMG